jgi:hypothetical protein
MVADDLFLRHGARVVATRLAAVRVQLSDQQIEVRLSPLQKALGLMGDITVARADVADVRVLEDPLHDVMRAGLKVGLRLPWLYYVCRTIRLDRAWVVRRGVPALSFAVRNHGALEQVTLSTPQARELALQLCG